jgi:L-amino acid N-acyltransferase YncA
MELMLRLAGDQDAEGVQAIYAPVVEHTAISFEIAPPSVDELRDRMRKTRERYPWLVCLAGDEVGGYVYASQHRERAAYQWGVDVTVYIHERWRRHGIGKFLYAALFSLLQRQGFYTAYAGITLPNAGSVGLHEALGFAPVGVYKNVGYKLGAWHDVGWWQLQLKNDWGEPVPPRPLAAIVETSDVGDILAITSHLLNTELRRRGRHQE